MKAIINNNLFDLKCVINKKDIAMGMMNKKFSPGFDGLLFLVEDGEHNFWMKNCKINLDIIFIDGDRINKIHKNCKPCKEQKDEDCERYNGFGNLVLEIKGGSCDKLKIKENDLVVFTD